MPLSFWIDILYCLYAFFCTAFVVVFLACFHDSGFQWGAKKAILLFLLTIAYPLSNAFLPQGFSVLFSVISILASFILPVYDYKGKKLLGFIRYVFFVMLSILFVTQLAIMAAYYCLPGFNWESVEISKSEELFQTVLGLLYFVIMFLLVYFGVYRRGITLSCGKKHTVFIILYIFLLIAFFAIITEYDKSGKESLTALAACLILLTTLLPVFAYSLRIGSHFQQRAKLQEVYMQSELEHFRQYMHAQEETRRFRHDIRNNLLCMREMVSGGNSEKLSQYLKDLLEITDSLSFQYVSGDELLDSILNSKVPLMEEHGIRFELDGVLAGGLPWKPMDICAVFANAMDNAVEACQKVAPENRYISMRIKSTPQFWLITIENAAAEAVDTKKLFQENGYTSKSDSSSHGIGTYNIKQAVESYGAIIDAKSTDRAFVLEIMIDKKTAVS